VLLLRRRPRCPPTTISSSHPGTIDRIISLQEAEQVSSLSPSSWKRNHPDKIVELSPRRLGVRLRDALLLKKSS
jgi:hypothetical protein